jgi:hypothetical protein
MAPSGSNLEARAGSAPSSSDITKTQTAIPENSSHRSNGVYRVRCVDGREVTVAIARAKVPASLAPLPPLVVASVMLLVVLAAAVVSVWVVVS